MKILDIITVVGPGGGLVTGVVMHVEPLKTRSGWTVTIDPTPPGTSRFLLRPEDEGVTWIYGDVAEAKDALRVANALGDSTQVAPKPSLRARVKNKRGTL